MIGGSSRSTSSSTTRTDVQNINLQDIEGLAVAGVDGDVTLTDQGAIQAARDIALVGLDTGRTGFSEVLDLAGGVLRSGQAQNETIAGLTGDIAARESSNTDARLGDLTRLVVVGAGVVLVVVIFSQRRKTNAR